MEQTSRLPGSSGSPLHPISPERANQRPLSTFEMGSPLGVRSKHERESSVQDKIAAFNSVAFQGKHLERKANDAALKRAMVGREEAESEMRRYRDEARTLRRHVEEGRDRERRVGERLESVMETYGRAKETHAHTQALWEKEIRRARKESFKSQSVVVKLQEELKTARGAAKNAESDLDQEKGRSAQREQEAFTARYQLVGVQEELTQMQERIKLVEQERDALRMIAQNEEIARIAAEGRIPLPTLPEDDEFASPKKSPKTLQPVTIVSSAASEEELEEMKMRLQWERRRADRAQDCVEFLELECRSNCCSSRGTSTIDLPAKVPAIRSPTINTVYIPSEGVFRTMSPARTVSPAPESPKVPSSQHMPPPQCIPTREPLHYARTPSCEPPSHAVAPDMNTSLLSLLDPQSPSTTPSDSNLPATFSVPTIPSSPSPPPPPPHNIPIHSSDETPEEPYHIVSKTTTIPLAAPADLIPPSSISPTMSREEALAQIRERRGRARSLANGTLTPKRQATVLTDIRRDISAPASAGAAFKSGVIRGKSAVRS